MPPVGVGLGGHLDGEEELEREQPSTRINRNAWQSRVTWALASRLGYVATVVCFIPNGADVAPFLNAALSAGLDKRHFSEIGHSADSNGGLRGVSLLSRLHGGRTPLCPSARMHACHKSTYPSDYETGHVRKDGIIKKAEVDEDLIHHEA